MTGPVLLAVAHGSREAAAQDCVRPLAGQVRRLDPGIDVRVAFLENAQPALPDALGRAGAGRVAIVPLLLATGYHVSEDIGWAAAGAGVAVSAPLGPDPALTPVLAGRLAEAGVPADTPVELAAAGSRDPRAARDTGRQAALLAGELGTGAGRVCVGGPAHGRRGGGRPGGGARRTGGGGDVPAGARAVPRQGPADRGGLGDRPARRSPGRGRPCAGALPGGAGPGDPQRRYRLTPSARRWKRNPVAAR